MSKHEEQLLMDMFNGLIWLGISRIENGTKFVRASDGSDELEYTNWWIPHRDNEPQRCVITQLVS